MQVDQANAPVPSKSVRLGRLEELVILATMSCLTSGQNATAQEIREILGGVASVVPKITTVITTIDRLIDKGCMTKDLEETPRPKKGGRRCRIHTVTPEGVVSVGRSVSTASALASRAGIESRPESLVA